MPGSDTPHLHQTVTRPSQAGESKITQRIEAITNKLEMAHWFSEPLF